MTSSPFGDRRGGRLHRALVYFGIREEPDPPAVPRGSEPSPERPAEPEPEHPPLTRRERALVYFGLAEPRGASRYGEGVSGQLDADIDDLRRRIAELEAGGRKT